MCKVGTRHEVAASVRAVGDSELKNKDTPNFQVKNRLNIIAITERMSTPTMKMRER
jgi:hypothetical protein